MKINKKSIYFGFIYGILAFSLLYVGIHYGLKQTITTQNYIAYLVFSIIIALVTIIFSSFKNKIGLITFTLAYIIAFVSMIYAFYNDYSGWQDLVGLLQMMLIIIIGIILSTLLQLIMHFIKKRQQNN